jgi:hypothetical protein
MFAEFFLEPYKQIYGYYHEHGVEIVAHHADSYAATLGPANDRNGHRISGRAAWNPTMSRSYPQCTAVKISFMGDIDNKDV